jgi:hypothetical protein
LGVLLQIKRRLRYLNPSLTLSYARELVSTLDLLGLLVKKVRRSMTLTLLDLRTFPT